ncbi:phosphatidylserine decarboxylase [Sporothrix bragantina]|uniref:Phosphatidylserine decarboxylase n=1 Tax=Sporothrix bragantina TaxID=671064 RepID=A0ABP0B2J8_9PEZI
MMRLYLHKRNAAKGIEESSPKSKRQIRSSVDTYKIPMADFVPSDVDAYPTFAEFSRAVTRPSNDPSFGKTTTAPRLSSRTRVSSCTTAWAEAKWLWIRGRNFSIGHLAMDLCLGRHFDGGAIASFRLRPQDYHRYHSPVTGTVKLARSVPGDYY